MEPETVTINSSIIADYAIFVSVHGSLATSSQPNITVTDGKTLNTETLKSTEDEMATQG